ncbi:hypothetical protein J1N35_025911 [Gossypium stocksii]|uniref:NLE domain-containing protein n=1 Tax=Gossypium stocksii TaxID=47602 RepID=A0A9D3V8K4_9ROSI|nr:hypothetical protein J1N35_025911 [Gossypium stocksii]
MEIERETNEGNSRRIQVRFITKLKAPYKVPTTAIAILSALSCLGLSSIVNKLLQAAVADVLTDAASVLGGDTTLQILYMKLVEELDCSPRTICRMHIMTGSYLYECLWEALQPRIRMILINMQLTPYVL